MKTIHLLISQKVRLAIIVLMLGLFFSWGVLVGKYQFFPYRQIASLKGIFAPVVEQAIVDDLAPSIETNLLRFDRKVFNYLNSAGLSGYGGGIALLGEKILGVDKEGHFFLYNQGGEVTNLNVQFLNNEGQFLRYISEQISDTFSIGRLRQFFRTLDVEVIENSQSVDIYASYHFWNDELKAKTMRLSRVNVADRQSLLDGTINIPVTDWELVYESYPPIEFSLRDGTHPDHPIRSNRSGGRMAISDTGKLYISVGDYGFDGIANQDAPQNTESSYGKIIELDLQTLEDSMYAVGVRNPQGLLIDREGKLWETEHGPEGGDELNLISPQSNYGWPIETLGTNYEEFVWSLNTAQGRHEEFEAPVYAWVPSIAPSNLIQIGDVPEVWKGDLLISSLFARSLYRIRMSGEQVRVVEPIEIGESIRDLTQLRDGTIVLWLDSGRFMELRPSAESNSLLDDLYIQAIEDDELRSRVELLFNECLECHTSRSNQIVSNAISLRNIVGRGIASTNFSGYSSALRNKQGAWDRDSLISFLSDTEEFAPGTTMPNLSINELGLLNALVDFLTELQ